MEMSRNDGYTTVNVLDYFYQNKYYRLIDRFIKIYQDKQIQLLLDNLISYEI